MAVLLRTSGAARGCRGSQGHGVVDPVHLCTALKGAGCVLCRLFCALASARIGSPDRLSPVNPDVIPKIADGGVGGPVGLALACNTMDSSCNVLVCVGDGRPVSIGKGDCCKELIYRKSRSEFELGDLPEDVLRKVFSKLHFNEVVRTSVLSRKWRRMWTISSRLCLDCTLIYGELHYFLNKKKYIQKFIDCVNMVLRQLNGEVVEEFEVRVKFDDMLVEHLNNWISFAVSSLSKILVLDLLPAGSRGKKDMYVFPFELLDAASRSHIQHVQLSYVSFKPSSKLMGFPNLKKLDLHLIDVSRMDLDDILSGCSCLEWLSLNSCCMKDELTVKKPLPHLLYLRIVGCAIMKLELHAENLKTFTYKGARVPIDLGQVKQLETAEINMYDCSFDYALTVLPNVLTGVRNFTLDTYLPLEMPKLLDRIYLFNQLKILRLFLVIDGNEVLSLARFLRAAPLIERLEVHFNIPCLEGVGSGPFQRLTSCSYNSLRDVVITGFYGTNGQIEFLIHIVENAPGLKVLTIDQRKSLFLCRCSDSSRSARQLAARFYLEGKISPTTEVHIL